MDHIGPEGWKSLMAHEASSKASSNEKRIEEIERKNTFLELEIRRVNLKLQWVLDKLEGV